MYYGIYPPWMFGGIAGIPQPDGTYWYTGKGTYNKRDVFKAHECKWNAQNKRWEGPREAGEAAGVQFLMWALVDTVCHEPPSRMYVTEEEAQAGTTLYMHFCGLCDSRYNVPVKILEVHPWREYETLINVRGTVARTEEV